MRSERRAGENFLAVVLGPVCDLSFANLSAFKKRFVAIATDTVATLAFRVPPTHSLITSSGKLSPWWRRVLSPVHWNLKAGSLQAWSKVSRTRPNTVRRRRCRQHCTGRQLACICDYMYYVRVWSSLNSVKGEVQFLGRRLFLVNLGKHSDVSFPHRCKQVECKSHQGQYRCHSFHCSKLGPWHKCWSRTALLWAQSSSCTS